MRVAIDWCSRSSTAVRPNSYPGQSERLAPKTVRVATWSATDIFAKVCSEMITFSTHVSGVTYGR